MARTFTKTGKPAGQNVLGEAAGLRWLAEAAGGARIARVLAVDEDRMELELIEQVRPSASAARAFGRALAHTHAAGAPWWGCPPDGWIGPEWVGNSRTPLIGARDLAPARWGEFYAEYRIAAFDRRLRDAGVVSAEESRVFQRLVTRLASGELDSAQPELVRRAGHEVARAHGDMWAGNVLYDGTASGCALIDPMAHGGHAETDLATLSVFGFPHLDDVYAGYDEESALDTGWRERIELHQLGIVIMHADLFGGGYTAAALRLASQYA